MKLKYIRHKTHGLILFTNLIQHREMAMKFGDEVGVASAGFVATTINSDGDIYYMPYGESVSLRCKPRPDDEAYINDVMNGVI